MPAASRGCRWRRGRGARERDRPTNRSRPRRRWNVAAHKRDESAQGKSSANVAMAPARRRAKPKRAQQPVEGDCGACGEHDRQHEVKLGAQAEQSVGEGRAARRARARIDRCGRSGLPARRSPREQVQPVVVPVVGPRKVSPRTRLGYLHDSPGRGGGQRQRQLESQSAWLRRERSSPRPAPIHAAFTKGPVMVDAEDCR